MPKKKNEPSKKFKEDLEKELVRMTANMAGLDHKIETAYASITEVKQMIETTRSQVDEKLKKYSSRVGRLENSMDEWFDLLEAKQNKPTKKPAKKSAKKRPKKKPAKKRAKR